VGDGRDAGRLMQAGVAAVVNLAAEESSPALPRNIIYCHFPLMDGVQDDQGVLDVAIQTLVLLLKNRVPALVYCSAGMSRAPAVAAAALSMLQGGDPGEKLKQIVAGQPHDVSPQLWEAVKRECPSRPRKSAMYGRISNRARKVMRIANVEAQERRHHFIETEDILIGLVKDGGGVGADVLKKLNVQLHSITVEVQKHSVIGQESAMRGLTPAPQAKAIIDYAIEEAQELGDHYVGTEHILVGLLRDGKGLAAQVLLNLGLQLDVVRAEIRAMAGRFDDEGLT
jgi:hypothetical protein